MSLGFKFDTTGSLHVCSMLGDSSTDCINIGVEKVCVEKYTKKAEYIYF